MIIRATQKKMMSKPVTSTDDGKNLSKPRCCMSAGFGQPIVLIGHSDAENQVSSTSLSRSCSVSAPW